MNSSNEIIHEDEIDLKELILKFWRGKLYILFCSVFFIFFGSLYLQYAEKKYTVEYKLKPVGEAEQSISLSGLGGIASLAGIQLPNSSTNDFKIFKELISSVEVSEKIFANKELIKIIFHEEWNPNLNSFSESPKSKIMFYVNNFITILTGNNDVIYVPPNARRLADYIIEEIKIDEDNETGFLKISAETSKPDMLLSLIINLSDLSDEIMRQRYIDFAEEPLSFYKEKLRTARSREHREALAELISNEEQKLMFASRNRYFTAEPYINPTISLDPTSPNPMMVLFLALILGIISGCLVVLTNLRMKDI